MSLGSRQNSIMRHWPAMLAMAVGAFWERWVFVVIVALPMMFQLFNLMVWGHRWWRVRKLMAQSKELKNDS